MSNENGSGALDHKDVYTIVDEKIGADAGFQAELSGLSDDDKATKLSEKKAELIKVEFATMSEKAKRAEDNYAAQKIRAEKAEKNEVVPKPITNSSDADELKLIARGLSDEEIDQAKIVAKGKDVSLVEAIKDPLFTTYQQKLKEDDKKEKARLGATSGSGESEGIITGTESGSTRDEHMAAFKKATGTN